MLGVVGVVAPELCMQASDEGAGGGRGDMMMYGILWKLALFDCVGFCESICGERKLLRVDHFQHIISYVRIYWLFGAVKISFADEKA